MSMISVKRIYTQKYPSPYSDCIDLKSYSSDLYDFIVGANLTYRQQDCFKLCIQRDIIVSCGCYSLEYPKLTIIQTSNATNSTRACLTLSEYDCLDDKKKNFNVQECRERSCPLECDSVTFDLSLSSLINPHLKEFNSFSPQEIAAYQKVIGANLTYEGFRTTWINVKVYFSTLQYTEISESPKVSIIDLFTQIGGSLGMFVSFSIFTLFELFEMFFLVVYYSLWRTTH